MNNKEVFIAKNGRPYVKDDNGKVKFISSAEWEQYKRTKEDRTVMKWLVAGIISVLTLYVVYNGGLV